MDARPQQDWVGIKLMWRRCAMMQYPTKWISEGGKKPIVDKKTMFSNGHEDVLDAFACADA